MKLSGYFILFLILINLSCEKASPEVYFHGRITLDCNNQIPAKNCNLTISQEIDEFKNKRESIADWYTDDDGYYAFKINVKQYNTFKCYTLQASGSSYVGSNYVYYGGSASTTDDDSDIELNCSIFPFQYFKFHIKNTNPVNDFDVLNSLQVFESGNEVPIYELSDYNKYTGIDVDETIVKYILRKTTLVYKYTVTKNNLTTTSTLEALPQSNCMDTLLVDVFY